MVVAVVVVYICVVVGEAGVGSGFCQVPTNILRKTTEQRLETYGYVW